MLGSMVYFSILSLFVCAQPAFGRALLLLYLSIVENTFWYVLNVKEISRIRLGHQGHQDTRKLGYIQKKEVFCHDTMKKLKWCEKWFESIWKWVVVSMLWLNDGHSAVVLTCNCWSRYQCTAGMMRVLRKAWKTLSLDICSWEGVIHSNKYEWKGVLVQVRVNSVSFLHNFVENWQSLFTLCSKKCSNLTKTCLSQL